MANNMDDGHFTKIFWYIAATTFMVFAYVAAITFFVIPKENVRFADTILGFLLGTVLGGGIAYLLSGSPSSKKVSSPSGTTNAEISATITSSPPNPDPNQKPEEDK